MRQCYWCVRSGACEFGAWRSPRLPVSVRAGGLVTRATTSSYPLRAVAHASLLILATRLADYVAMHAHYDVELWHQSYQNRGRR